MSRKFLNLLWDLEPFHNVSDTNPGISKAGKYLQFIFNKYKNFKLSDFIILSYSYFRV